MEIKGCQEEVRNKLLKLDNRHWEDLREKKNWYVLLFHFERV